MSFCGNCGSKLDDGARFCPNCGAKTVSLEKPETPAAPPAAQQPAEQSPSYGAQRAPQQGGAFGGQQQHPPQQGPASFPPPPAYGAGQQQQSPASFPPPSHGAQQQPQPYQQQQYQQQPPYQPPNGGGMGAGGAEGIREMFLTYHGRLNRKPYILRSLVLWVIMMVLNGVAGALPESSAVALLASLVLFLLVIALCVPAVMLTIRRWHDLGKSGWFTLLALIPFVGFFVEIYLWAARGTVGPNQYGEDPLAYRG